MVARSSFLTMALAATASSVTGFSFPKECRSMTTELSATRRHFVSAATGAVLLAGTAGALPAFADVASGDSLPQGAQQFSTMIRVRKDLKAVAKRVKDASSEMNSKEWDNVSQFLRQIYSTGDDMKTMAGGIVDPAKKKQALADAESLRKTAKSADVPVSQKDGSAFLKLASKMDDTFESFMDQLSDIPDEL